MAENHVLLETIELSQSASSVTFDNIPQSGYSDLKIVMSARSNGTDFSTPPWQNLSLKLNATNPSAAKQLYATAAGTGSDSNTSGIWATDPEATANTFSNVEIYLPNYLSSIAKSVSADNITENNGTDSARVLWAATYSGVTASVTSITLTSVSGSLLQYSTFSLYGIAATGTTPVTAPKATGGNIVANDGTYWYHAFLTSGYFTPQTALTCDYLVVAGGGGGSGTGGGGAGGLRTATSQSLTSGTNYTAIIGAGGAVSVSGNNSSFNSFATTGGGKGRNNTNSTGSTGGSGGGGSDGGSGAAGNAGSYTPVEGYAGGTSSSTNAGGGGGGASAVGSNGQTGGVGGAGGTGVTTAISGGAATGLGHLSGGNYYFAGGGGGGSSSGDSASNIGGGGKGGNTLTSNNLAIPSTGGGGGGLYSGGSQFASGSSGVVIIRYAMV